MTIEERLEQVENMLARAKRRNRWLVVVIVLAAGVWVALAGVIGEAEGQIGGQVRKTIFANAFVLMDERDRVRATLKMIAGGPSLTLADKKGTPSVRLDLNKDGASLCLSDKKGRPLALLATNEQGTGLTFYDDKGKARTLLHSSLLILSLVSVVLFIKIMPIDSEQFDSFYN